MQLPLIVHPVPEAISHVPGGGAGVGTGVVVGSPPLKSAENFRTKSPFSTLLTTMEPLWK